MFCEIIKNNIQILVRSKSAMLLLVGSPLLLFFFAGIAFDNANQYTLIVGYLPAEATPFQQVFLDDIENAGYKVQKYDTLNECRYDVKRGSLHTCMEFTEDFRRDNQNNGITFHIDYTRMNIIDAVLHALRSRIALQQEELGLEISKKLVQTLEEIRVLSDDNKFTMVDMTTQNQEIAKRSTSLREHIQKLSLPVDLATLKELKVEDEGELASWLSLVTSLSDDLVREVNSLEEDIRDKLDEVSISESDKIEFLLMLEETDEQIDKVRDKIYFSSDIPLQKVSDIKFVLKSIIETLQTSKQASSEQEFIRNSANQDLNTIMKELDENLVNLVKLQNSFNEMGRKIGTMNVIPAESIVLPVRTSMKPVAGSQSRLNYIFPTLLGLILMYGGILLASLLIIMQRGSPAALRNKMVPTKTWVFFTSHFITVMGVLWVQILAILLLTSFFMGISIFASLPALIVVLFLISSVFTLSGMLIGNLADSEEIAVLLSIFVSTMLLLTSGLFLPLESMPEIIANILAFNPLILAVEGIKQAALFHMPLKEILEYVRPLAFYCAGVLLLLCVCHQNVINLKKIFKRRQNL